MNEYRKKKNFEFVEEKNLLYRRFLTMGKTRDEIKSMDRQIHKDEKINPVKRFSVQPGWEVLERFIQGRQSVLLDGDVAAG